MDCPEITKTQSVRLLDVFLFGPFLLYIVTRRAPLETWEKTLIATLGLGIMYYNGQRYLMNKDLQAQVLSFTQSLV